MSITEAQARRALRHANIPWNAEVDDPRESPWVVHDHRGLLGGLAAAFATGCRTLRRAEDFFADLGVGARRAPEFGRPNSGALGLGRGTPCDTTFYRLLVRSAPGACRSRRAPPRAGRSSRGNSRHHLTHGPPASPVFIARRQPEPAAADGRRSISAPPPGRAPPHRRRSSTRASGDRVWPAPAGCHRGSIIHESPRSICT
jgi:hypothetical protein